MISNPHAGRRPSIRIERALGALDDRLRCRGIARDLRRDLFWYFRSYCLLTLGEDRRLAAGAFALGAALLAPENALRFSRALLGRDPGAA